MRKQGLPFLAVGFLTLIALSVWRGEPAAGTASGKSSATSFRTETATVYGVTRITPSAVFARSRSASRAKPLEELFPACPKYVNPTPGSPANASGANVAEAIYMKASRPGVLFEKLVRNEEGEFQCKEIALVPWEDYWTQLESQDLISKGSVTLQSPPFEPSRAGGSNRNVFVVSMANSRINGDRALFVAVAKAVPKVSRLVWHMYRIQITHAADGGHFCAPSATALIVDPIVGVTPAGRLFVAFDSLDTSTFTFSGSVLDIDTKSLLSGGPAEMKCFTGSTLTHLVPPVVRDDNRNAYFVGVSTLASVRRAKLKVTHHVADDTLTATPDIDIPSFDFNPSAIQPNGFQLFSGGFNFQGPSIQIGAALWNLHQIGDAGGHEKVRLYKLKTNATAPDMTLTLSTLPDESDDTFAPSFETDSDAPGTEAFVTFSRTIAADPVNGKTTLMMARGPNASPAGWTFNVLAVSKGQFTKNLIGQPCDPTPNAGCNYGPISATVIDPTNNLVVGSGETITNGDLGIGGKGNESNWAVETIGVPR